jgi:hypothetical protein
MFNDSIIQQYSLTKEKNEQKILVGKRHYLFEDNRFS